jgi:hypothetical protein
MAACFASGAGERSRLLALLERAERSKERWPGDTAISALLAGRFAPRMEPQSG